MPEVSLEPILPYLIFELRRIATRSLRGIIGRDCQSSPWDPALKTFHIVNIAIESVVSKLLQLKASCFEPLWHRECVQLLVSDFFGCCARPPGCNLHADPMIISAAMKICNVRKSFMWIIAAASMTKFIRKYFIC